MLKSDLGVSYGQLWYLIRACLDQEDTFSTTMIYRASLLMMVLSSKFKSPVIAKPEEPQAEQSTASLPGS